MKVVVLKENPPTHHMNEKGGQKKREAT
ncbi:hypothetical protein A2U01_0110391, partial [Trifolium medium]|nr:hypothetical protein [Trifolium medium]